MRYRFHVLLVVLLAFTIHSAPGRTQWIDGGLVVSARRGGDPAITVDGAGGVIVTWHYTKSFNIGTIFAQRIGPDGDLLWTADGAIVYDSTDDGQTDSQVMSDGAGGAVVVWENDESNNMIYVQRIDSNGAVLWDERGVCICVTPGKDNQCPRLAPCGAGGAVITWFDGGRPSVHVQRVSADGDTLWRGNGMPCSASANKAEYPDITSDGASGAIVVWHELAPAGIDVFAQRIDADGDAVWGATGAAVCDLPGDQWNPQLIGDGAGGVIATWDDRRSPGYGLYAQRLDATGDTLWHAHGNVVSTAYSAKTYPKIVPDDAGGAIIVWLDNRDGEKDIYAQRIDADGDTLWPALGVPICTEPTYQREVNVIADGAGGAIVAWEDIRLGGTAVYTQRVDAAGAALWDTDGVLVGSSETYDYFYTRLASDGRAGAIVTWQDNSLSSGYGYIYAQRVSAEGEVVAAALKWYRASHAGPAITLEWELAHTETTPRFAVMRGHGAGIGFEQLPADGIVRDGLLFQYTDRDVETGGIYRYRIDIIEGPTRRVLFETGPVTLPAVPLTLHQNYPNPFNPSTAIAYDLPERCHVALSIYAVDGRPVARLIDREELRGRHEVRWDGWDCRGNMLPSGIYWYRLSAGKTAVSKKMVLMR